MIERPKGYIPFKRAVGYIILSLLLVSGSVSGLLYYIKQIITERERDPKFNVVALAQKNSEKERLSTVYLAELLDLSRDHPSNLYQFNVKEGQHKLEDSPLIKEATIKKIKPGTLFIQYKMRLPIALLGDYTNTGIDEEGVLIPLHPFFSKKKLPVMHLGISAFEDDDSGTEGERGKWGNPVVSPRMELALELLHYLAFYCPEKTELREIDVAKAFALSYGQRQIVIVLEEKEKPNAKIILRLSTHNYKQELANFLALRVLWNGKERGELSVIDLRIPHLAFVSQY